MVMEEYKKEIIELLKNENIENFTINGQELIENYYKENKINKEEYNELILFFYQQIRNYRQIERCKKAIVNYLKMR